MPLTKEAVEWTEATKHDKELHVDAESYNKWKSLENFCLGVGTAVWGWGGKPSGRQQGLW